MKKFALCCIFVLIAGLILVSCSSGSDELLTKTSSEVAWVQAWNSNCADWNFAQSSGISTSITLGQMHFSTEFYNDIEMMNINMSMDLGADAGLSGAQPPDLFYVYIPGGEIEPE